MFLKVEASNIFFIGEGNQFDSALPAKIAVECCNSHQRIELYMEKSRKGSFFLD